MVKSPFSLVDSSSKTDTDAQNHPSAGPLRFSSPAPWILAIILSFGLWVGLAELALWFLHH
jgi:hypothetical protein